MNCPDVGLRRECGVGVEQNIDVLNIVELVVFRAPVQVGALVDINFVSSKPLDATGDAEGALMREKCAERCAHL